MRRLSLPLSSALYAMKTIAAIILLFLSASAFAEIADKILVSKSSKMLYLQKEGKVFASYPVVFGGNPVGHSGFQAKGFVGV